MKYTKSAPWYDLLSAEPVYRAGRRTGIALLGLRAGDRVLDVGCGTGLNFGPLRRAVSASGLVVGVDRSPQMLHQARRRVERHGWANVDLVAADATELAGTAELRGPELRVPDGGFDAVLFTYALSLMPRWEDAWRQATGLLRPGGRAAVVDLQSPVGAARAFTPLARLACRLGGADIEAHPWTLLERESGAVRTRSRRGGHIQVRAGVPAVAEARR